MASKDILTKSYQTLIKTVKFICNFSEILSPISYATVFRYQRLKYPLEMNFLHLDQSSKFWTNVKNSKESKNGEDDEVVISVEDPTQPLVKLTIITTEGKEVLIEARVGMTVMKAITKHSDLQMEAVCGGELACTTCHVYCEEKDKYFTEVRDTEQDLLDAVPCSTSNSRLCCQMKIIKKFDNVRIQLPNDATNYFDEGSRKFS